MTVLTTEKIEKPKEKDAITFDSVIDSIGQFGWAQAKILLIASWFDMPMAWAILFFLYGGYNPGFYCLSSQAVERNLTLSDIMQMETSSINTSAPELWAADVCAINATTCSSILFKPGYQSIITEFSLVCEKKYVSTACTTSLMLGILFGAFLSGHFSDKYGRRYIFSILAALMVVTLYVQALSVNWIMFAIVRFVAGFSAGGTTCIGFILPLEVIGPKWRTISGCLGLWQVGNLTFAGLGYGIREWRKLSLVAGGIATPGIALLFFCHESPRWLIQRGKIAEATKILQGMARLNKKPEPSLATIGAIKRYEQDSHTIKDLFRNRTLTLNTVTMCYLWFSCTMCYYGLSMNTRDLGGNIYLNNIILALTELMFALSILYTGFKFGRKPALVGYMTLAVLCLFTAVTLGINDIQKEIVAAITSVGRGANSAAWSIAYLLSAEVYPTVIRSIAGGSCSTAGRVGGVLAPQIAYLTQVHFALPPIIFGVLIVGAMILSYLILPETGGKPLQDVLPPKIGCCTAPVDEPPVVLVREEVPLTYTVTTA